METTLRAFFCPCCGARIEPPSRRRVDCAYCDAVLHAEGECLLLEPVQAPQEKLGRQYSCSLRQARQGRFESSWLHQRVVDSELDLLNFVALDERRCALVYLRRCDREGRSRPGELPMEVLLESLRAYPDPGLAAHQALEWLCQRPQGFGHLLECAICLFDEQKSKVTVYTAGCPSSVYWLSNEAASLTELSGHQSALERKMLLEARDNFSAREAVALAALDSVVFVSAGFAGRGDGPYASGSSALVEELREQLGEDPLRVVTMAKNAFWTRRSPAAYENVPGNSLQVVAVQARPWVVPDRVISLPLTTFGTSRYEAAILSDPDDFLELLPLHGQRAALVWVRNGGLPFCDRLREQIRQSLREILDRPQHGDNENPRVAGRLIEERVPLTALTVVQFFDQYGRVKYYRRGVPHPVFLSARGLGQHGSAIMAYDEGGEVTLDCGQRLLFLGNPLAGQPLTLADLANDWPGGKTSGLYLTLAKLWTTPPTEAALRKVLQALMGDGLEVVPGTLLVTGKAID